MNSTDPLLQPLSLEEIEELEDFLASDSTPEECMTSMDMLDGYMTALIAGPEVPHPDVWISYIWDQENGEEPAYLSDDEASVVREYLLRHMNSIAMQFEEDPEVFCLFMKGANTLTRMKLLLPLKTGRSGSPWEWN